MSADSKSSISDQDVGTLVALVRAIAELDDFVTLDESEAMNGIAEWVGDERFWSQLEESRQQKADVSDLEGLAGAITDPTARKTIYSMLRLLAASDGTDQHESAALERVRVCWGLPAHGKPH